MICVLVYNSKFVIYTFRHKITKIILNFHPEIGIKFQYLTHIDNKKAASLLRYDFLLIKVTQFWRQSVVSARLDTKNNEGLFISPHFIVRMR